MKKIPALLILSFPALFFVFSSPGGTDLRPDSSTALETARQKITEEFTRIEIKLKWAAERLGASGLTGDEARAALEDLCRAVPYAVDCAAVDSLGRMVTIEPAAYRHLEGKDISDQEQVKRMLDRRNRVLSRVFMTVEGIEAEDVEYPVTASDGSFLGAVSLLFLPEKLLTGALDPAAGETANIVVMETTGRILYHADQAGIKTIFLTSDALKTEGNSLPLWKRLVAEPEGTDVQTGVSWLSVSFYDTFWRLVALA
jgi:hypothetical protein